MEYCDPQQNALRSEKIIELNKIQLLMASGFFTSVSMIQFNIKIQHYNTYPLSDTVYMGLG